jgi:hypothetical protein
VPAGIAPFSSSYSSSSSSLLQHVVENMRAAIAALPPKLSARARITSELLDGVGFAAPLNRR